MEKNRTEISADSNHSAEKISAVSLISDNAKIGVRGVDDATEIFSKYCFCLYITSDIRSHIRNVFSSCFMYLIEVFFYQTYGFEILVTGSLEVFAFQIMPLENIAFVKNI
jgi:hypothetical protein